MENTVFQWYGLRIKYRGRSKERSIMDYAPLSRNILVNQNVVWQLHRENITTLLSF